MHATLTHTDKVPWTRPSQEMSALRRQQQLVRHQDVELYGSSIQRHARKAQADRFPRNLQRCAESNRRETGDASLFKHALLKTVSVRFFLTIYLYGSQQSRNHKPLLKTVSVRFLPTNLFTRVNSHETTNLYSKQLASDSLPTNFFERVNGRGT